MYNIDDFVVGDEFDASPSELSQIISAILAEGGSFDYEGTSVTITSLPNRKVVLEVVEEDTPEVEEVVPEIEEVVPKVEEVAPEVAEAPAPKTKGRPRKNPVGS